LTVMLKKVGAALKTKAWTYEVKAKAKAIGPDAKANSIKFGL